MDDLDNPKRRSKGQPSDYTSANNYGFGAASTGGENDSGGAYCVAALINPAPEFTAG
jgi:hypothetical protein